MKVTRNLNGTELEIALEGRLDAVSAPELERELQESLNGVTQLTFDLEKLNYISSAGLRVLLSAKLLLGEEGTMKVKNVNEVVQDVFDATGFSSLFSIE
ncbi:MAG: STAS domain-containing protein [Blautia sp.]|nr:STAS domain-containing protein [Blautia sp.]